MTEGTAYVHDPIEAATTTGAIQDDEKHIGPSLCCGSVDVKRIIPFTFQEIDMLCPHDFLFLFLSLSLSLSKPLNIKHDDDSARISFFSFSFFFFYKLFLLWVHYITYSYTPALTHSLPSLYPKFIPILSEYNKSPFPYGPYLLSLTVPHATLNLHVKRIGTNQCKKLYSIHDPPVSVGKVGKSLYSLTFCPSSYCFFQLFQLCKFLTYVAPHSLTQSSVGLNISLPSSVPYS